MKGKGWKLNPHWVMLHENRQHINRMQRLSKQNAAAYEMFVRSQQQIADSLESIEGQKQTSTAH